MTLTDLQRQFGDVRCDSAVALIEFIVEHDRVTGEPTTYLAVNISETSKLVLGSDDGKVRVEDSFAQIMDNWQKMPELDRATLDYAFQRALSWGRYKRDIVKH